MTREPMGEHELEATLVDLGERLAYPRPTRMGDVVRARLRGPRAGHWWDALRSPRYAFTPLVVTLSVLALAVLLAVPDARAAADEFLRLRGINVFRTAAAPSAPAASGTAVFPGQRVTLEEARRRAPFLLVPSDARLGAPDGIYIDQTDAGDRVTLVYASRAGIPVSREAGVSAVVVAFRGRVNDALFAKVAPPGTVIDNVVVNGGRGFWIAGAPHQFYYVDAAGRAWPETLRLAGNTLLWEQGGATLRLEAQISRDEAVEIAASFR
ncbi:MAG TPA: hypothetical protein VMQ78_08485 [Candidatus Limnocylindria bacterium]|nr:hypothetical protein [Candidatus Limnocylindria bacterium]